MEVIFAAGDVIPQLPDALAIRITNTEEGIECSRQTIIGRWNQRAVSTGEAVAGIGACSGIGSLDTWQVCFKSNPLIVRMVPLAGQWTGEEDRSGMQLCIAIGPDWLVWDTIKATIR